MKMTREVYDLLKPRIEGRSPDDAVFTWSNGKPVTDFREAWRQLIEAKPRRNLNSDGLRRKPKRSDRRRRLKLDPN